MGRNVIHVVQSRHAREQDTHWDKTKELTSFKMVISFVFLFPLRLQRGGFVPREALAGKGLLLHVSYRYEVQLWVSVDDPVCDEL